MSKCVQIIVAIIMCVVSNSCSKDIMLKDKWYDVGGEVGQDEFVHDELWCEGVVNAIAKARLLAGVEWTPISSVPSAYSTPYTAGVQCNGIPYSLAQQVNGLVGLDVSVYTFLSAVANPRSVIYTEDLKKSPYNGFDVGPYYGSVCSASVWYILGIAAPYYTYSIDRIPELKKMASLSADSVALCDVLWNKGHVAMVYDIGRDETGAIRKVTVFETTRTNRRDSKLVEYSFEGFCERWSQVGWVVYRPKNLTDNPEIAQYGVRQDGTKVKICTNYNEDLCTSRGDRVAYIEGDSIVIDIFSNSYTKIELISQDKTIEVQPIKNTRVVYNDLTPGFYSVRLTNNRRVSEPIYFEVIDINVKYQISGNMVDVFFSSDNATPEYMSLGDSRHCPYYCHVFTDAEKNIGKARVQHSADYLKVHFRGQYGCVSNNIIKLD